MELGKHDEGLQKCEEVLKANENFFRAHIVIGIIEENRGNIAEALDAHNRAKKIQPKNETIDKFIKKVQLKRTRIETDSLLLELEGLKQWT